MGRRHEPVLAIGERFNQKPWKPKILAPIDEWSFRVQAGLYNHGSRRVFLDNMGVHWNAGINLLWPSNIPGDWDEKEARDVFLILHDYIVDFNKVILFGRRVCDAANVPYMVGKTFGRYIPLPHPIARSKLWDKCFIERVLT